MNGAIDPMPLAIANWTVEFPAYGTNAAKIVQLDNLVSWKELWETNGMTSAKSWIPVFSGTAAYRAKFALKRCKDMRTTLDLGQVEAWAKVRLNGKDMGTLWCYPYAVDITDALVDGENELEVLVTSTWYNKLVHDARLPPESRSTWTIHGPVAGSRYLDSGLLGPVTIKSVQPSL